MDHDVGGPLRLRAAPIRGGGVTAQQFLARGRRIAWTDRPAARGSTAPSTSASTCGSTSRAGSSSSAASAVARGQSSSPSASAAHVPGSRSVSSSAASASTVAAVLEQFRIWASSSAKNSLTPAACRPTPGSQSGEAAPGSPIRRSAESGRRAASPATNSTL